MKLKIAAILAASALALPLPLMAQEQAQMGAPIDGASVKSVDVNVDISAIQNAEAAAFWAGLEADLENALLARLVNRVDGDEGANLSVDISEVELASGFAETGGLGNSILRGSISQTHDSNNARFDNYDLTVDVRASLPYLGEGFDVEAVDLDGTRVYRALIDTFADHVASNVK
ncbi:hypothetical protein [Pseudogemmobacter sonorensis]|uniref:hypothetical protein n=1 Tax=Pseudogemmobacter sonorensis TaxID=2989681 RepID=UPI00369CAFDA